MSSPLLVLQHIACEPPAAFEDEPGACACSRVSPELAEQWGEVPAYARSLERILGAGALERLVGEVREHADRTLPLAPGLFARWLERVACVPAPAIG